MATILAAVTITPTDIAKQLDAKANEMAKLVTATPRDTGAIVKLAREIDGLQKQADKAEADKDRAAITAFELYAKDTFGKVKPLIGDGKAQFTLKLDPPNSPVYGYKLMEQPIPDAVKQVADKLVEGLAKIGGDKAGFTVVWDKDGCTVNLGVAAPKADKASGGGGNSGSRGWLSPSGGELSLDEAFRQIATAAQLTAHDATTDGNAKYSIKKVAVKAAGYTQR